VLGGDRKRDFDVDGAKAKWLLAEKKIVVVL